MLFRSPLETLTHIQNIAKDMFKLLKEKLNIDGLTLCQNNEYGQEVKHYHLHLKPYYQNRKTNELIKYKENINDPKEIYTKIK